MTSAQEAVLNIAFKAKPKYKIGSHSINIFADQEQFHYSYEWYDLSSHTSPVSAIFLWVLKDGR